MLKMTAKLALINIKKWQQTLLHYILQNKPKYLQNPSPSLPSITGQACS
jgi:hypothetical protein